MRISTTLLHQNGIDAILSQQSTMHHTQLQLASGKRVLTPSDDPAAAALTVEVDQKLRSYKQYQKNIDSAESRLSLEETTLEQMTNILQRARELAVEGNNGSLGASNRKSIALEIGNLLDSMVGLANTTDANGDYLFSGLKGSTRPFDNAGGGTFTYSGDQGQRRIQVGPSQTVADSDSGHAVFMDVKDTAGSPQSIFTTLYNLQADLNANVANPNSLGNLDNTITKISEIRSGVGARRNALTIERDRNDAVSLSIEVSRSKLNDLDYAQAVGQLSTQMAGLEAAQKSYTKVQGLSLFNYL